MIEEINGYTDPWKYIAEYHTQDLKLSNRFGIDFNALEEYRFDNLSMEMAEHLTVAVYFLYQDI